MKTIYISGKITGTDDFRERFAAAESKLKLQGWRVYQPCKEVRSLCAGNTMGNIHESVLTIIKPCRCNLSAPWLAWIQRSGH